MRTSISRALVAAPTAAVITFGGFTGAFATEAPVAAESPVGAVAAQTTPGTDVTAEAARNNYSTAWMWEIRTAFEEVNRRREAAGLAPVVYNVHLSRAAQASANRSGDTADFLPGGSEEPTAPADTPRGMPSGGTYLGQTSITMHTYSHYLDDENHDARETYTGYPDDFEQKVLDPRVTHVGIGGIYVDIQSEDLEVNHLVLDLWQYPESARVLGSHQDPWSADPGSFLPPAASPFADVATDQQFYKEMSWLADRGISTGWDDGTYRALQPINRDAMAAFLYRLAGEPEYTAPAVSPFADVATDQQFYKEMAWLSDQGISTGWTEVDGTRTYRALQPINRDAMAAFLYRLAGEPEYAPTAPSPFADVAANQRFATEMAWLAEQGISTGWTDRTGAHTYRPLQPINRDAMAAFTYRYAATTSPR
ncbi:hypothetical protein GCM10011374_29710 [Kocuria dechangensis]|uniref:SLH domain-containing protein n=1 Tax=Kocuria dechangensis TaxID=1176249 RepID=A0A917LYJ1_9MICC|nr:hypothetical protein GCM10011374_29710 [Kocuria dechangensis]